MAYSNVKNRRLQLLMRTMDAVPLLPTQLLIAGPTTGKTTLQKASSGLFDTDDLWEDGNFFKDWHEMPNSREVPLAWIIRMLNGGNLNPWMTNIWGKEFLSILVESTKGVIFVYRDDPQAIFDIMHSRSSSKHMAEYTLDKLKGWVEAWQKFAPTVSNNVIVLQGGDYLSDFVYWDVKNNKWSKKK